jgi:hypothetical protein
MKCGVCGGELKTASTDLPFKISEDTIVIVKVEVDPIGWTA